MAVMAVSEEEVLKALACVKMTKTMIKWDHHAVYNNLNTASLPSCHSDEIVGVPSNCLGAFEKGRSLEKDGRNTVYCTLQGLDIIEVPSTTSTPFSSAPWLWVSYLIERGLGRDGIV